MKEEFLVEKEIRGKTRQREWFTGGPRECTRRG